MKHLFSVLMLAAIATFTFAFTTPKAEKKVLTSFYHFVKGTGWVQGPSLIDCEDNDVYCEISIPDQYAQYFDQITSFLSNNNQAPDTQVDVTVNLTGGGTAQVPVDISYQP